MFIYALYALAAILAVLVVIVALQPAAFSVTRSATIAAPPPVVFEQVNDLQKWREWSPWEKIDPNLQRHHDGPRSGVGATYAWVGNKNVGEGRMTITESEPHQRVVLRLEFLKPFKATNRVEFTFTPETAGSTRVTWTMSGRNGFIGKAMHLVMNIDKMCGPQFEEGLAAMKTIAESEAQPLAHASAH